MRLAATVALVLLAACTRPAPAETEATKADGVAVSASGLAPEVVAPELKPLVTRADRAIAEVQETLLARLTGRLAEEGPVGAVAVCASEAQELTASVGERHGVEIGRTAARLRNPRNAPRPWVKGWLARNASAAAADARPEVFDLGDRLGVVRPIATGAPCLLCHGEREAIDPATLQLLAERYPADEAVGFAPGQLRGAFWVEVPKAPPVGEESGTEK